MGKNRVTRERGFVTENLSTDSYGLEIVGDVNIVSGALLVNGVTSSSGTSTAGALGQVQLYGTAAALSASSELWYGNQRLHNSGSSLTAGRIYINEDLSGYITSSFGSMFFRDTSVAGGITLETLSNGGTLNIGTFTGDGNLLTNIKTYLVNPGATNVTLTVPGGQRSYAWTIIKSGSAAGTITIDPNGALINGAAGTLVLSSSLPTPQGRQWTLTQAQGEFFVNSGS